MPPESFVVDSWTRMITGLQRMDLVDGIPIENVRESVDMILKGKLVIIAGGNQPKKWDIACLGLDEKQYDIFDIQFYWRRRNFTQSGSMLQPISLRDIYYYYYKVDLHNGVHDCVKDARATMRLFRELYVPKNIVDRHDYPSDGFPEIVRVLPKRCPWKH